MSTPAFELESSGYTHLAFRCRSCGAMQTLSFGQLRSKVLDIAVWSMTAEQIAGRLHCDACPSEQGLLAEPVKRARRQRGGPVPHEQHRR